MSSSGHGQSLVKDASELAAAWLHAHDDARAHTGRVIVEGMVDFDYEITVLTVRTRTAHGHCTMVCAPIGHRQVGGDYVESWQPQPMTERAWESAQTIATTVVDALGGYGLYGVELFIKGDEVIFSEVSPRPHDTGMVTMATQRYSEFDLHARAILGLPIDTAAQYIGASAAIKSQVESTQPRYTGLLEAVSVEETDVRIFGKPVAHPGRRMGVAISRADSVAEARERACEAASLVHVEA